MPPRSISLQPLPDDLPRHHVDTLFGVAARTLLDHQVKHVSPDVSIDTLIRAALQSTHGAVVPIDDGTGVQFYGDPEWKIPADRALQFATLMRFATSDEGEIDMQKIPTASQWLGLADAWALRQGLFQEDDSLT